MITSSLDICNMALDYINCKNITSFEQETKEAKKCSMWYDTVRKSLLLNMNASFSIKRAILSQVADFVPIYGYEIAYALPSDCLQVLNLDSPIEDRFYQIEGRYFYCETNDTEELVKIRYIADVEDVTQYDAEFCICFALKLAEMICSPLTEDEQKYSMIRQLAQQKYVETSTKYGRDNKMIVINTPKYRQAKEFSEIQDYNYLAK